MEIAYFIIYLVGCIVSLYTVIKFADPSDMLKSVKRHIKSNEKSLKFEGIFMFVMIFIIVIPAYVLMSWGGALVTYVAFTDSIDDLRKKIK